MRAAIVAANNIRYSPYIFFYTEILKTINLPYELIVPDRNGLNEESNGPVILIPWNNKLPTIINYFKYTHCVKRILRKEKYDLVIALTGINAAFLGAWLKRNFRKRYIVDIRDYSHENIYPYYALERTAVNNSLMNVISSRKFTEFLPESKYLVCHNIDDKTHEKKQFKKNSAPICIGYVGGLSYVDQCTKMMKLVSEDSRFTLEFFGTSDQEQVLKNNAEELQCNRIKFHGGYVPEEKAGILSRVDILFNAYGSGIPLLDCALSNKLYDSFIHKKPILTCAGTYMTEMAGPLAFPIDLSDNTALDQLYNWYQKINGTVVDEYADRMIDSIRKENDTTKQMIAESILALNGSSRQLNSTGR